MSFLLGLTGSIGMGKTTTANMFADHGVPVWDADAAVHRLYGKGGAAVGPIQSIVPDAISNEAVDRKILKQLISDDPQILQKIEQIVHPLVAQDREDFKNAHDDAILLFDIPLLFETGADAWLNAVVVVTVPPEVQKARVMARDGMTQAHFEHILSRQVPDTDKRARADYIIETTTLDAAANQVDKTLAHIKESHLA